MSIAILYFKLILDTVSGRGGKSTQVCLAALVRKDFMYKNREAAEIWYVVEAQITFCCPPHYSLSNS